jgi:DNA-binding transcriptional LysR family regulator
MLHAHGFPSANLHEVATLHDLIAVVSNGLGAAILPRSAPRLEAMRRMPITDLPLARTVSAYAIAGRRRDTAAATFLNLMRSGGLVPA